MSETRYITYNSINNLIPEDLFKEFLFKSGANSDRSTFIAIADLSTSWIFVRMFIPRIRYYHVIHLLKRETYILILHRIYVGL